MMRIGKALSGISQGLPAAFLSLAVFAISGGGVQAAVPTFEDGSTMAKIQSRGTLRVGVKTTVPLFGQKNPITGEVEGIDAEMARLVGRAIFGDSGHIQYISAPSASREVSIMQDKVDMVIATYTILPERRKKVSYAGPYYFARYALLVSADNKDFGKSLANWEALNKPKISVCAATDGQNYMNVQKYAPEAHLVGFEDEDKCVTLLQQDRVQSYASDTGILLGVMLRNPGKFRMIINEGAAPQEYGIGVRKDDVQFCEWINKQLLTAFRDGEWKAAYEKVFQKIGGDVPEPPKAADLRFCKLS